MNAAFANAGSLSFELQATNKCNVGLQIQLDRYFLILKPEPHLWIAWGMQVRMRMLHAWPLLSQLWPRAIHALLELQEGRVQSDHQIWIHGCWKGGFPEASRRLSAQSLVCDFCCELLFLIATAVNKKSSINSPVVVWFQSCPKDILQKCMLRRTKEERKADLQLPPIKVCIRKDKLSKQERLNFSHSVFFNWVDVEIYWHIMNVFLKNQAEQTWNC